MSQGPRRFIEDPEWGGAFEGLLDEHGPIDGLPDDVRADVALMIAASVAGAVGITAAGVTASSLASASGSAGATGGVSSVMAGGFGSATAGSVGASAASVGAGGVAAVGSGVASTVGVAATAGSLGAAGASLAALGALPKIVLVLSLAGAATAGGAAVVNQTQSGTTDSRTLDSQTFDARTFDSQGARTSSRAERGREQGDSVPDAPPAVRLDAEVSPVVATSTKEPHRSDVDVAPKSGGREASAPEVPSVPKTETKSGLAGEVSLLGRARSALSVNREYAWTLLTEYHRRYPEGTMRAEYEALVRRAQTAPVEEEPKASPDEKGAAVAPLE